MSYPLTPHNYDEVVSALTGNGVLCTTLSPTSYHVAPTHRSDMAHQTQFFVMAGRRRFGPDHPLINFGTIGRSLLVDGEQSIPKDWRQEIDWQTGAVTSEWVYAGLEERTRSFIALNDNVFLADTVLTNSGETPVSIQFKLVYQFGETEADLVMAMRGDGTAIQWSLEEQTGEIGIEMGLPLEIGALKTTRLDHGVESELKAQLEPGESAAISTLIHFSDRQQFEFPLTLNDADSVAARHEQGWADFWSRSEVITGVPAVDAFRQSSLYTLRCQATPWSIPPTLSHPYWGAGTFHDEMYPFFGLLTSNYPELAERIPLFRLSTLPEAIKRAHGRGALYPWSSTESGDERDPHGLWLTERFHLGQFAACIHHLWLYERDLIQRDDLYPVLRELARYFEMNVIEQEQSDGSWKEIDRTPLLPNSRLRTKRCVDFDESVGAVTNGPFTISAAIATLEYAADAALALNRDDLRIGRWRVLASRLRANLPSRNETYTIPDDKPLHYSILGPIFPFRVDVDSSRATASAQQVHEVFRSTRGWKPGFSDVFNGSNWMWTGAHLGIVHAMQGNAALAWEAVRFAAASAGPFLSPNEHVTAQDEIRVPWFTTGCGGWLYALNSLFIQVNEEGTLLLPALDVESLPDVQFRHLRAHGGVLVSGEFQEGKLISLSALTQHDQTWTFRIPSTYTGQQNSGWNQITVMLKAGVETPLLG